MRSVTGIGRFAAIGAVLIAVVVVGAVLFGAVGGTGYTIQAEFLSAGQLVKGNLVQLGGAKVGTVKKLDVTQNGLAIVTMNIGSEYAPLYRGTKATIRQQSVSGIANRYVDLELPANRATEAGAKQEEIPSGGVIGPDSTTTAVDLDEVFNTLDPVARVAVQDFFKGSAQQFAHYGKQANAGFQYLDPALSTSRRLFNELNLDTPLLEHFLVDSAKFMTTVADRKHDLTNLVTNLNATTRALGNQKLALAQAIHNLPEFMRTANTTFVNLRSTLDNVDPLVNASKPVAIKLQPFLHELRPFARDARPTVHDLNLVIRRPGAANDLVELNRTFPPLASTALDTKNRTVNFGAGPRSVGRVPGAFPEMTEALKRGTRPMAEFRPYTPDLFGWFDDFSDTGAQDATGNFSRVQTYVNFNTPATPGQPSQVLADIPAGDPLLKMLGLPATGISTLNQREKTFKRFARLGQYKRCPGAAESRAGDGSNVFSKAEQKALDCQESARATGP